MDTPGLPGTQMESELRLFEYRLQARDGRARAGEFLTPHGVLRTPLYAPVGTQATVKALTPQQLQELGAALLLANTYHLYLRPGEDIINSMGGLHDFMAWPGPLLTDSGGFQVFSLADRRQVDSQGVTFHSHLDGSPHRFTPESTIAIQEKLGADITMTLDECAPPYGRSYNEEALERTHRWAERCLQVKRREDQALFGIVQGGVFPDLRIKSAKFIASLDLPGIAIGGLSVGESKEETLEMLDVVCPLLQENRLRYLMGVGSPEDIVEAVLRGIDLFDCVLPTRMARNHAALTRIGRINLRNAAFANDHRPIDDNCSCYTCQHFSRAYLRHLIMAREMLSATLLSIHNLHTMIMLVEDIRLAIFQGELESFAQEFRAQYQRRRPEGT
jgi:queuine tRNA-ribosyltransferase